MQKTGKLGLALPDESADVLASVAAYADNFRRAEDYVTSLTQVCTASNPSSITLAPATRTVSFTSLVKSGYAFELSGGSVRVLEPGFVMADIHLHVRGLEPGDSIVTWLSKNGSSVHALTNFDSKENWITVDVTSQLVPCAADDVFGIAISNDDAQRGTLKQDASYFNLRFFRDLNFLGTA